MSPTATQKALHLPEILDIIARAIPTYDPSSPPPRFYTAYNMLPCLLVCRLWYRCFLPHLYCYCIEHFIDPPHLAAFRSRSHLFRWYESYGKIKDDDLPFEKHAPPTNLVGLVLHELTDTLSGLLWVNQGSQLKQLTWPGYFMVKEIALPYQKALKNLPCLEELDLKRWIMNNDLLYDIFVTSRGSLRTLVMESIAGFDKNLFFSACVNNNNITITKNSKNCNGGIINDSNNESCSISIEKPLLELPRLTRLQMLLDWSQSRAAVLLPSICPALESLQLTVDIEEFDLKQLTATLRAYCPRLKELTYIEGYSMRHKYGYFPDAATYASLFKDSAQHLQSIKLSLPDGLDSYMLGAILEHASTLECIRLSCNFRREAWDNDNIPSLQMPALVKILTSCAQLRKLKVTGMQCHIQEFNILMDEQQPWACRRLESLVLDGYRTSGSTITVGMSENTSDGPDPAVRKMVSKEPLKLCHHEYRDEGWFLTPGLDSTEFCMAVMDGPMKRRFLSYLNNTSSNNNGNNGNTGPVESSSSLSSLPFSHGLHLPVLKTVQLNETVFYREEQLFLREED
ncbi:hypothetical protein BCR41DRAFT_346658, partial [Lobosporangium transversale]